MRLRVRTVRCVSLLGLTVLLGACGSGNEPLASAPSPASRSITNGPSADYPMVLGNPFTIEGVTYTPSDTLNVDEVGYAAADDASSSGVTAAHRTLPLPSYVEVTALDSGRTALVRVERRGPMTNNRLVALSPAALAQLGIADGAPVRLRRVNPPEDDRAELRSGHEAPLRMDTPPGLLTVLKRRLPETGSASLGDPRQSHISGTAPNPGALAAVEPHTAPLPAEKPVTAAATAAESKVDHPQPAPEGRFAVQIGAFSLAGNAEKLAKKIGGFTVSSGNLTLVRAGPFASRGQADTALAKLKNEGYSDARIVTLK